MDVNAVTVLIIAIVMTLVVGFFDALAKSVTTKVWDKGYLVAMFIYSIIVGYFLAFSGAVTLDMPFDQIMKVSAGGLALYFVVLEILHTSCDAFFAKYFPDAAPQGLATLFIKPETKMELALYRK